MFFVIWRGRGIAVVGLAILGILTAQAIVAILGGINQAHVQGLGAGIGLLLAAAPAWFLGKKWNAPLPDRVLVDQATGQQVVIKHRPRHTLYYVPMEYWGVILAALGGVVMLSSLVP